MNPTPSHAHLWAPQEALPRPAERFLRHRLEAALEDPKRRLDLIWPALLGAPRLLRPGGLTESELFSEGGRMLRALGCTDPAAAFADSLTRLPDTAEGQEGTWRPHPVWGGVAPRVSLLCGMILVALTTPLSEAVQRQGPGAGYRLGAAVTLFNCALFHPCHDALEGVWLPAAGPTKRGLQGLILVTAGYFHQQRGNRNGMRALWAEALDALAPFGGELETGAGCILFGSCLEGLRERLAWLDREEADLGVLWTLPRPSWEMRA